MEILNNDDAVVAKDEIQNTNIIRHITDNISIRKGPRGNYIFYKPVKMKKPQFFGLDGFVEDVTECDKQTIKNWILETAHLSLQCQKETIKSKLLNFKLNYEQTDDISFVIIEI